MDYHQFRDALKNLLPCWLFFFCGYIYFQSRFFFYEGLFLGRVIDSFRLNQATRSRHNVNVQIGTGFSPKNAWLNTDYCPRNFSTYHLNALRSFPFQTSSIDHYYTEHQLEHFSLEQGVFMLKEILRTLKPDGKIRISVPGLEKEIAMYQTEISKQESAFYDNIKLRSGRMFDGDKSLNLFTRGIAFNEGFYCHGHCFIYDYETLSEILKKIGFINVCESEFNESDIPVFRGIDSRDNSLIVEAQKPSF